MKSINTLLLLLFLCSLSFGQSIQKYTIGNGPEDFALDTFSSKPRLIVSCHERRDEIKKKISYFYSIDINSKQTQKMFRINEPEHFYLSLVGIDIERLNNKIYLYATSHSKNDYKIVKYQVKQDSLFYVRSYSSPLFYMINDVDVYNGNFIVSNGRYFDGSIVYCDSLGNSKILIKHINYANGVLFENDSTFYYSATFDNVFVKNKIKNLSVVQSKVIAEIKGPDNIIKCGNAIYITSHPRFIKFMLHMKNPEKKSPIAVYEFVNNKMKKLYTNDGHLISAASAAVVYKNKLFLSQIFDDFLLQIDYSEINHNSINSTRK